ncbi:UDP-4-amino-4,6-dideoxy-N-acetyl-beta-L-altrosamine transaminase [Glaciecola sp. 2405UD65-10]|uniref:UDP-4-amino-4, 6-dideoxy-N-acetyl-beta-L-altrosamine transaminase n=1 Tax=Glaciecola sp. 2405UD65-10 TaxID=3397244 RepID=UPI003B5947FA
MINYGKHNINDDDVSAVVDVLQHHFLTQGSKVPEFEKALCDYTQASYCTAVNSGTSGLHVACMALEIGVGDIVWTSPNSFAASANCALYCGASIDFVDIDPHTRNMSVDALKDKLLKAQQQGQLPKALVLVHFSGEPCDMQAISQLCKPYNIAIIEDAAHALGAYYHNKPIGACQYSDITVLSFHPVKSITTAEGGAVLCNNAQLAQKCVLFAKHGITRSDELMQHEYADETQGPWYYQQLVLGYNYRLSDLQAALGISQLKRIDEFMHQRRHIAKRYLEKLNDLPLALPSLQMLEASSWHLFMVEVKTHERKHVYEKLHAQGIAVNVHYIPIHLHPFYQQLGFKKGDFPAAEKFYDNALTLPIYVGLDDTQQDYIINTLKSILA